MLLAFHAAISSADPETSHRQCGYLEKPKIVNTGGRAEVEECGLAVRGRKWEERTVDRRLPSAGAGWQGREP